jgi:hypothetical protein
MEPVEEHLENTHIDGVQTTEKDISLFSLVPKFAETGNSCPLHEFFEAIESAGSMGNWSVGDRIRIAT